MKVVVPLLLLATVVMAVLKLAGVIAWPWLAVLTPLLVLAGIGVISVLVVVIAWIVFSLTS